MGCAVLEVGAPPADLAAAGGGARASLDALRSEPKRPMWHRSTAQTMQDSLLRQALGASVVPHPGGVRSQAARCPLQTPCQAVPATPLRTDPLAGADGVFISGLEVLALRLAVGPLRRSAPPPEDRSHAL